MMNLKKKPHTGYLYNFVYKKHKIKHRVCGYLFILKYGAVANERLKNAHLQQPLVLQLFFIAAFYLLH